MFRQSKSNLTQSPNGHVNRRLKRTVQRLKKNVPHPDWSTILKRKAERVQVERRKNPALTMILIKIVG